MIEQQQDSLSPEKLQLFIAGLSGLSREEIVKAKSLYIRNAISEYRAMVETLKSFRVVHLFFALIPIFWPFIYAQKRSTDAQLRLARERIRNAIDVWKDDLRGEKFDLDDQEVSTW
ncbi:MAG: hypothetical protein GX616_14555 [Planctomycetes bacterium]|nr:hypothetical protein [Planctomycetota bacterium]